MGCSRLAEMVTVRNLGMHNRWECDEQYPVSTSQSDLDLADLRPFDRTDVEPAAFRCGQPRTFPVKGSSYDTMRPAGVP